MKTSTLLVATLLGFAIATTQGQTQSSTTTSYVQTSKIVGMKIKDSSGQEVGVVKDVVLDRNTGCMAYTVLSTGGTGTRVTGGAKTVAVPWTVYTTTSDPSVMTVRVERDRVYNAPAFDYARIDEYSTSGYINNVYSYYGVTPGVGVGVGVSGTTTGTVGTQTSVSGQAAATASPGVAASPAATAMASPTAASSPSATPRGTASPTGTAKATATSPASRRATATPSSEAESTGERRNHRHGESSATASPATSSSDETTTERATGKRRETTSEEGTSETGSAKKSKRSKTETSEESSPAEPSATP